MATAKSRAEWNHTAALMALIANVNRNPKAKASPWRPEDFHPLPEERRHRERAAKMPTWMRRRIGHAFLGQKYDKPPGRWENLMRAAGESQRRQRAGKETDQ